MFSLKVLGPVTLFRDGVPHQWLERGGQRTAVLAVLAACGARGISRERLAALLWPDSADTDARHSLDVLLSKARTELKEKEFFAGVANLRLNREVVQCDLFEAEDAIANGHVERLEKLRNGPFADGLRTAFSEDLERLVDATRRRVDVLFVEAYTDRATAAMQQGNHGPAARWWDLAAGVDLLSVRATLGLIQSYAALGQITEALRIANAHKTRATQELGAVDRDVLRWIKRLEDLAAGQDESGDGGNDPPPPPPDKRRDLLVKLLGRDYQVGELIIDGTAAATYSVLYRDGTKREAHLLQPRMAAAMQIAAFERAFRKVMRLAHPCIVPTFDIRATIDGLVVIAGVHPRPRLRDTLKRHRGLSIASALGVAINLADAVRVAHRHQCIHGDLRPKHVFVGAQGALLGSFGFAEVLATRAETDDSTVLTLGSPRYQSPEQITAEQELDESADVYALGTMLFEMLAGHVPFEREGRDPLMKLGRAAPLIRTIRETVPASLEDVIAKSIARYPADRFASMAEFHAALTSIELPRT